MIAAQTVARAPADGYSLLLTTTSFAIMQAMQPKLPFSLLTDFAPVGQVISAGFVLVAHPSVPATSLDELIRLAQAKPGFINCASTGPGTAPHLGCEMLRTYAKADVVHVPYNGTPPAVLDLLAGRVHILIATGPASVNLVQEGKLKALAVTGRNRVGALPQIPTMAELGRPELEIPGWNGVHAPAGTPPEVIARLSAEILKAVGQPEVGDKIRAQGFDPDPRSADAFGELVRADVARWTAIVKATGAKPE